METWHDREAGAAPEALKTSAHGLSAAEAAERLRLHGTNRPPEPSRRSAFTRTLAVNTIVVMEIFHLFFIRNIYGTSRTWAAVKGTPAVWITVLVVVAAQFAITYLPPLQRVFDTRPVAFTDGLLVIAIGVTLFALIETEKQIRLRLRG